jgi:starch-binding outer membrane protein, SusD/RagB family
VNRVLSKIDGVDVDGDANLTAQKNYIKGQLLALRAMGHFELLEGYAKKYDANDPNGVPIMLTPCLTCQPPRNTVAEVIAQVEKDLADGMALMPAVVPASYNDLALNQLSVTAVQARVALYKREWQKAADLATTVINSGIKPLVTGTAFSGIWTDANTNEILFRSRYETSTTVGAQWNNAGIIFSPSDKLNGAYPTGDIRKAAYIGTNAGGRYVKKFSGSSRGTNVNDIKNIRIAEMYLIRAEARAELNDLAGAAADINALRTQRIVPYNTISYASKDIAIADIILERYRELAFEGFRFYDLKRKGLDLQRAATDVDSPLWQTLAANNFRFVYPIPSDEMLANRNIVQNEGY